MFYFLIIISLFCAAAKASVNEDLRPVYADESGLNLGYGWAPMGVDEGETLEDLPCVKDIDNKNEYVCASGEFVMFKSVSNKCKTYIYSNLYYRDESIYKRFVREQYLVKKGELIGYIEKGSNIKPKIVNTCNKHLAHS